MPLLLLLAASLAAVAEAEPQGVRQLTVAENAWAGSSVNVVANARQNLFTEGRRQYAAFYDAEGVMVLARRALGSDSWETRPTAYKARVADAHNSISLVVDGAGYVHVAWDHHDSPLRYARSLSPGSLELGPPQAMTGHNEDRVSYPQFFRLPDGDLLFLYRDGQSGSGILVLDRYSTREGRWSPVQSRLVDGEGRRSPYWSMTVDAQGTLHLAWNWRDTPDVASNHDLAYARSRDGGQSWTRSDGTPCRLPLTAANTEYAIRIPLGSNLMNPPVVAADRHGRPLIASYWSPSAGAAPQLQVMRHNGSAWKILRVGHDPKPFSLSGGGTKHPPLSRAVLLVEPTRPDETVHLVFRDDSRGGRIVAASLEENGQQERWRVSELTEGPVGAWEPSFDPVQWSRLGQLQMLVQNVAQRDGDDARAAEVPPSTISSLIWSPRLARRATPPPPAPVLAADQPALEPAAVLAVMQKVADWQIAHPSPHDPRGWEVSPFYLGLLALDRIAPDHRYRREMVRVGEANAWEPGERTYHADDHCVIQAYLELHEVSHEPRMIAPSRARLDAILATPSTASMDWDPPRSLERWTWCDALFMAPMSWLLMGEATGDARYRAFMDREWLATTDRLFDPKTGWYFRDESFLDLREPNGKTIHWSRGNGWVVAGLSRVLSRLPENDPVYPRYRSLYGRMMEAALAAQQPDGLWRPGLLDPVAHPQTETSGSSFMTFAMAFGLNHGFLDRARFGPAVGRAWRALTSCVTEEGKLEHVQPIGDAPQGFDPHHTDTFGVGAFLLAGSEVHRLVSATAAH